jgi:hypothetical protein
VAKSVYVGDLQERRSTSSEKPRLANLIVSQFIAAERSLIPAL